MLKMLRVTRFFTKFSAVKMVKIAGPGSGYQSRRARAENCEKRHFEKKIDFFLFFFFSFNLSRPRAEAFLFKTNIFFLQS